MFMLSFFELPKGVRKRLDFFSIEIFLGKAMVTKGNTDWLNGTFYAGLKTNVV
jgi:hypothetical protein